MNRERKMMKTDQGQFRVHRAPSVWRALGIEIESLKLQLHVFVEGRLKRNFHSNQELKVNSSDFVLFFS